jgi:mannose PTS system EIIA component
MLPSWCFEAPEIVTMIGVLLITHEPLGDALIACATHVQGRALERVSAIAVAADQCPADMLPAAQKIVASLDGGQGVLVLTDLFGASPSNLACRLIVPGRVEAVAGVNVPMLLRALASREMEMATLLKRVVSGGAESVFRIDCSRDGGPCASETLAGQMRTLSST